MCCSGLLKILMFVVNGGIFAVGAAILGVGIWVTVDASSLLGFLEHIEDAPEQLSQLGSVGYLLIGLGTFLTLVGFLGCCGAVRESRCMLLSFFIIVLIIFIAEIAGAIVLFLFQPLVEDLMTEIQDKVVASIEKSYGSEDGEGLTTFWDNTMSQLDCCGYSNYTDFTFSPAVTGTKLYPAPCCSSEKPCGLLEAAASKVEGCFPTLVRVIEENSSVVAAVALAVCAVEIAAMVVSMILYKKAGKSD